jgi:hypothetical protein
VKPVATISDNTWKRVCIGFALVLGTTLLYDFDRPERSYHSKFDQVQVGMSRPQVYQILLGRGDHLPPCGALITAQQDCWFRDSNYAYLIQFRPVGDLVVAKVAYRSPHRSLLDRLYARLTTSPASR